MTWRHASAALKGTDGLVTVFPPLALTGAIHRDLFHRDVPIVAWCFNVGSFPTGLKRKAARVALRRIDRIVVHSSAEVDLVREFLDLDEGVVQFKYLQRAPIPQLASEEHASPFIVAMGSANRDYATLFEAARRVRLPLVVVAAKRVLEGLDVPPSVTVLNGLSPEECWRLAQRARISVVPIADVAAASGQVTVIEAMRMARPVIATRSIGTTDYIEEGRNGHLVEPNDPADLAAKLQRLWDDAEEREIIARGAEEFAERALSDAAAGRALISVLDEVRLLRAV